MAGNSKKFTLKNLLAAKCSKAKRHPSIGCHQRDLEIDEKKNHQFHTYAF